MTKSQVAGHLAKGGVVVEELTGQANPNHNFRLEWRDPAAQSFHDTPEKMARHLWERQQWLSTTLTLIPIE